MRVALFSTLLGLTGCFPLAGDCPGCDEEFDCISIGLSDENGDPDGCDLAACTTCVDTCGQDCLVLESYPPQYACDGLGSWDVYDFCPDWTPPYSGVSVEGIEDLGCGEPGLELLTAEATPEGRITVTHTDYLLGCCPSEVEVTVEVLGDVLIVDYALVDDRCDCVCALDVRYDLVGVAPGNWTLLAAPSGATVSIAVPGDTEALEPAGREAVVPGPRDTALRSGCNARGCDTAPGAPGWLAFAALLALRARR